MLQSCDLPQPPLGTQNTNKWIFPSTYLYAWEVGAVFMILNKVLNTASFLSVNYIPFSKTYICHSRFNS